MNVPPLSDQHLTEPAAPPSIPPAPYCVDVILDRPLSVGFLVHAALATPWLVQQSEILSQFQNNIKERSLRRKEKSMVFDRRWRDGDRVANQPKKLFR